MKLAPQSFEDLVKLLGVVAAIIGVIWTIVEWSSNQRALQEHRRVEAQKPFLDQQLKLYAETVRTTAFLATNWQPGQPSEEWRKARNRFNELYWGELATVENHDVEVCMVKFGRLLDRQGEGSPNGEGLSNALLQQTALKLAGAVRASLDESWGLEVWNANRQPKSQELSCLLE
jgi:hypothetical protein